MANLLTLSTLVLCIGGLVNGQGNVEYAPYDVLESKEIFLSKRNNLKNFLAFLSAYETYEVRRYPAQRWASTDGSATNVHDGQEHSDMFDR